MALRSRRSFLLFAANDANVYQDLTKDSAKRGDVSYPEPHPRKREPVPAGAGTHAAFLRKCVGCLKCIPACPRGLLRVSGKLGHLGRPALDFRHGWCYPECSLELGGVTCVPCSECAYCMTCPYGVDIPGTFHVWNSRVKWGGVPDPADHKATRHFLKAYADRVPPLRDASRCIGCGDCARRCPQWQFSIPEELAKIDDWIQAAKRREFDWNGK